MPFYVDDGISSDAIFRYGPEYRVFYNSYGYEGGGEWM